MTLTSSARSQADRTSNFGDTLTRQQRIGYILMLGALVALGPFTVDLYLPAFPAVVADLHTTDAAIQLTLTATTIGFGLGQLIVGPLSDSFGRRRPLLIATTLHIAASVFILFADSVEMIMVGRVFQGIGAAGGAVVAMAMIRDLFSGQRLVRMLSRMALVTGLAPVLAPVIGSQMLNFMDWRGIFAALALYGLTMAVVCGFLLVETHPVERRGRFSAAVVGGRYKRLLRDPGFVGIAIVGAATFTMIFAYLAGSSFVLQDVYGLSAQQFGLVFGINSIGLVIGTQVSARLMRRFAPPVVTTIGLSIISVALVALVVCTALDLGLWGVLIPLFFAIGPAGLVMPTVQVMALADHPLEAGTAASLIGAANMGVAGAVSPLVGVFGNSALSMASVMLGAIVVGQLSLWLVVRRRHTSVIA